METNQQLRDLVLIAWARNPANPNSRRTIVASRIIGNANPCRELLEQGTRLSRARRCLLNNGFSIVFQGSTGSFSGFVLFQR